ncbi:MAG: hypothetical protein AABY16_00980 [Nanoarchaeota archaeon]
MSDNGYSYFGGKRKSKNDKRKKRKDRVYKRGGQFRAREDKY